VVLLGCLFAHTILSVIIYAVVSYSGAFGSLTLTAGTDTWLRLFLQNVILAPQLQFFCVISIWGHIVVAQSQRFQLVKPDLDPFTGHLQYFFSSCIRFCIANRIRPVANCLSAERQKICAAVNFLKRTS
jgi:hypothetical protein